MKPKLSTSQRGYGPAHQRLRARIDEVVQRGEATCWRCGRWIKPGSPWDLGHDDNDRSQYKGPEHAKCNRGAPNRTVKVRRFSRDW